MCCCWSKSHVYIPSQVSKQKCYPFKKVFQQTCYAMLCWHLWETGHFLSRNRGAVNGGQSGGGEAGGLGRRGRRENCAWDVKLKNNLINKNRKSSKMWSACWTLLVAIFQQICLARKGKAGCHLEGKQSGSSSKLYQIKILGFQL